MELRRPYSTLWLLASPYLDTRRNDIHTRLSTSFALVLLQREEGDEEIVIPAILLHDVGWKRVPEALQLKAFGPGATLPEVNRIHEIEGRRMAGDLLRSVRYPEPKTEEILSIIEGHDSRKEAISLNDRIVKDADKLWRFTEEGFRIDLDRFQESRKQGLHRLEVGLHTWFHTPSAREMAERELRERDP
jgi:HD superfamily phosphodiesterase